MKYYEFVNSGLVDVAVQELQEVVGNGEKKGENVISFESDENVTPQSARRIVVALAETKDVENIEFTQLESLPNKFTFKVEVENVKGQDSRIDIARKVAGSFFEQFTGEATLDLKKPQHVLLVYREGETYYIGFSDEVGEVNARAYRVFAHHASFKGDLAYYIVRKSGFEKGKKLLVGFCKDGSIAIEAALFAGDGVTAFDESRPNVTAARKNAKIAKVDMDVTKCGLDDLDVKFNKDQFDTCIFHVTHKDEENINELYYQTNYVLKQGGTLLIAGREKWDVSISDKFELVEKTEIVRGDSVLVLYVLRKW